MRFIKRNSNEFFRSLWFSLGTGFFHTYISAGFLTERDAVIHEFLKSSWKSISLSFLKSSPSVILSFL